MTKQIIKQHARPVNYTSNNQLLIENLSLNINNRIQLVFAKWCEIMEMLFRKLYCQHMSVIRHEIAPNVGGLPMASGSNMVSEHGQLREPRLTF